jgi:hypothetical protein
MRGSPSGRPARTRRAVLGQALAGLKPELPLRGEPVIHPRHRRHPDDIWVAELVPDATHLEHIAYGTGSRHILCPHSLCKRATGVGSLGRIRAGSGAPPPGGPGGELSGLAFGGWPGDHCEVLRGNRDDATGTELGSSFGERIVVNTGTVPVLTLLVWPVLGRASKG